MAYLYWVSMVIQCEGKAAFHGQYAWSEKPLKAKGAKSAVNALINTLTFQHVENPEPGTLPVVPFQWQLVDDEFEPSEGEVIQGSVEGPAH